MPLVWVVRNRSNLISFFILLFYNNNNFLIKINYSCCWAICGQYGVTFIAVIELSDLTSVGDCFIVTQWCPDFGHCTGEGQKPATIYSNITC